MSTKKLSLAITTMLPLLLIGCGGGGGSSSDDGGKTQIPTSKGATQTMVHFDLTDLHYKEYKFIDGVEPRADYYTSLSPSEYILTKQKIYNNEWIDGDLQLPSELSVKISEVPKTGRIDALEKIDLTGKKVYQTVYPGFTAYFDFYRGQENMFSEDLVAKLYNQTNLSFPKGSMCYRVVRSTPTEAYLSYDSDQVTTIDYDEFIAYMDTNVPLEAKKSGSTVKIDGGTWMGVKWKTYREYDKFGFLTQKTFVEFNNKLLEATLHDFEPYDVNKLVAEQKLRLNAMQDKSSDDYQHLLLQKTLLEQGCEWYNPTAADTVKLLSR